ncbi:kelch repeat-containing protein [Vitiosangium sp. GDMCC 1.1324]|uniref:Kelch repeat-containing protein n=1 Tax=Vitiosangium sp. (strain GDMCC 1.1324) TaxID=2138576 RepID=UPI000D3B6577|nr:kelch repeat-containing protein [Vitiosangium sp. GDMCC 1.1324]PTL75126.1 hypothetical protein DAT35_56495 [Vitiosangium sp. GDMCC 1.1324]
MNTAFTPLLLALTLALFSGDAFARNTSSAQFIVSVPESPNAPVSRVSVVASADDFSPLSLDLSATGDVWKGTLDNIPPGPQRSFRAQAFDASNTLLFEDSISGITLAPNKTRRILLELEEVSPPSSRPHASPRITQSSQSSPKVRPGRTIDFKVTASDPERSVLTFTWSASSGSVGTPVSDTTRSRASWTAPACASPSTPTTLTATVTNAFGLTASTVFTPTGLPPCASGWAATGSTVEARIAHAAVLLPNGKVLVSGGSGDEPRFRSSAELYDPATGTWSSTGSMVWGGRAHHPAVLLPNGKVLVMGGSGKGAGGSLNTSELYDPATGTWRMTGPLHFARTAHAATLLSNGKVLVAGGVSIADLPSVETYDPATEEWTYTKPLLTARYHHTATLLSNGKVLVAGGEADGVALSSVELYDPATGTWSFTGPMATARREHTATLLPNGKVLVVGGTQDMGQTSLASAELYDPATGTWSPTSSMVAAPRNGHCAMLLPNGKVLVAGGSDRVASFLSSAEVYDPSTGTWSLTNSMAVMRVAYQMTLLPGGKVLSSGGSSNSIPAEVYTP